MDPISIPLKIDGEEVNRLLVEEVLKGTVGAAIRSSIEKNFKDLTDRSSVINDAIKDVIVTITVDEVRKHEEEIRAVVSKKLTEDHIKMVFGHLEKFLQRGY